MLCSILFLVALMYAAMGLHSILKAGMSATYNNTDWLTNEIKAYDNLVTCLVALVIGITILALGAPITIILRLLKQGQ